MLLIVSAVASVIAFRLWLRLFTPRIKAGQDLADQTLSDWPEAIGLLLPRRARRIWNGLLLGAAVLILGLPHFLALRRIAQGVDAGYWPYVDYLWTLAWWLALLGLPAVVFARSRLRGDTRS